MASDPPRILLAKPGLDGHDRGLKAIALGLRDAGAEVVYLGLRCTVAEILNAATQEDVDVIGVSILSGAHLALGGQLLAERDQRGLVGIPVVMGGTIPPKDARLLIDLGASAVFSVGADLSAVITALVAIASAEESVA